MEADRFKHREEKASFGDLIRRLSLVVGVALPLVIATATDWDFSWTTPQFVQLLSREIPQMGRISMSFRLPTNEIYPLWLNAGVLSPCNPKSERIFNGFALGVGDDNKPFAIQIDSFRSLNQTCSSTPSR